MEVNVAKFSETKYAAGGFDVNWLTGGGRHKVVSGRGVEDAEFVGKI